MTKERQGAVLLILGIAAWVVYYALRFLTPLAPPFGLFLAWHLAGVIPGSLLRGSKVVSWLRQTKLREKPAPTDAK
jgi:hypothetical protein